MKYEQPGRPTHAEAEDIFELALRAASPDEAAAEALVGLALEDEDPAFVEVWSVRLGRDAVSLSLRGTAALCIGHVARRFGQLSPEARQTVYDLAGNADVRAANGQVLDALDDVQQFAAEFASQETAGVDGKEITAGGVLVAMQRALLDLVTPSLRAVAVRWSDDAFGARFIYAEDRPENAEMADEAEGLALADFTRATSMGFVIETSPPPAPLSLRGDERAWVYRRREP